MGGNSVTLVMKALGKPEREAVEWLGDGLGVPVPQPSIWRYGN